MSLGLAELQGNLLDDVTRFCDGGSKPQQLYWAYEEVDAISAGDIEVFRMSILFANGAELQLPFSELRLVKLQLWQGRSRG